MEEHKAIALLASLNAFGGGARYNEELVKYFENNRKDIDIIKDVGQNTPTSILYKKTAEKFRNLKKYKIIHNAGVLTSKPLVISKNAILISTAYEFQTLLYPNMGQKYSNLSFKKFFYKLLLELPSLKIQLNSDYLISISTQTKEEAIKLGYEKNKIFVINLGLDDRFIKYPNKEKEHHGFKVGYISTIRYRKGLHQLAYLIDYVNKDIKFEAYGKIIDNEYFNTTISKLSSSKKFSFRGIAPEDKIVDIYDSFDAFIFPSLYEGFGLEIPEAQARGLPVIIYKNSKIPKEVRKYCFEAESSEHMAQIIMNHIYLQFCLQEQYP